MFAITNQYSHLDFMGLSQLLNAILHKEAIAPSNPAEGQMYYNTTKKKMEVYNGTEWLEMPMAQLTIASGSESYLGIVNGQLVFKDKAITSVNVDNSYTTIDLFVATEYANGNEFQEGDMLILNAAEKKYWIHNGGILGTKADFSELEVGVTPTVVRGYFAAGSGLEYTEATGTFAVKLDANTLEIDGSGNIKVKAVDYSTLAGPGLEFVSGALQVKNTTFEIGDGSATTFTVVHGLGVQEVGVEVMDQTDSFKTANVTVERPIPTTVVLHFASAPALNQFIVKVWR